MRMVGWVPFLVTLALGAQGAAPPTLAVLPIRGGFQTAGTLGPRGQMIGRKPVHLGEELDGRVLQAFFQAHRFQVIERARLNQVLGEAKLQQEGMVDDAQAVTLGRQLGARFVVVGAYSGAMTRKVEVENHLFSGRTRKEVFQGTLDLDLRVVDTETGAIQDALGVRAAMTGSGDAKPRERLLDDLAAKLGLEVARHYPLRGFLVRAAGTEAVIDLGTRQGVRAGDRFRILDRAPDLVHPVTGAPVQGEFRAVGELQVATPGEDSATATITGGRDQARPGMRVERRPEGADK